MASTTAGRCSVYGVHLTAYETAAFELRESVAAAVQLKLATEVQLGRLQP